MSDLSITAANVLAGETSNIEIGTAGATITAGQPIYLDASTSTWKLMRATTAVLAGLGVRTGISLSGAASAQPLVVKTAGTFTVGATVTKCGLYVVSAALGAICPAADLTTGQWFAPLFIATTTTVGRIVTNSDIAGVVQAP